MIFVQHDGDTRRVELKDPNARKRLQTVGIRTLIAADLIVLLIAEVFPRIPLLKLDIWVTLLVCLFFVYRWIRLGADVIITLGAESLSIEESPWPLRRKETIPRKTVRGLRVEEHQTISFEIGDATQRVRCIASQDELTAAVRALTDVAPRLAAQPKAARNGRLRA